MKDTSFAWCCALSLLVSFCNLAKAEQPNVVLILADDLGWSDTSLYGKTDFYRTPHLQSLAKTGVTFRRAYSASPLCSPTRASILTGLHPARIGLTSPSCHLPKVILKAEQGKRVGGNVPSIPNSSVTRLNTSYYTLGEAFRDAGYVTGHFGKWHLGHPPYSPLEHGFATDVPHWPGPGPAGSYVAPWKFPDFDPDTPKEHIEDRMAKEADAFIRKNKDKPFFLNYWMFSVHAPFDAKQDLIQKYRRQIKPDTRQRSPTYAAMVESMDDAVGSLMQSLKENGLLKNTIVVFYSDNGGNMYNLVDKVPATNNFPLRGGKATQFEGGIRVPCTVSFPGKIPEAQTSDLLIQSTDLFPTLVELTGIKLKNQIEFDGVSVASELRKPGSESQLTDRAIFSYFPHQPRVPEWLPPSIAVHHDHWKLIRIFYGGPKGSHRHLLFDLESDIGESKNVAEKNPEVVKDLGRQIDDFLKRTDAVLPARNNNFDYDAYDQAKEGKSIPRPTGRQANKNPKRSKTSKPKVAGWQANQQCDLKLNQGNLIVESTGNDPNLSFDLSKPLSAGTYTVTISMSSNGGGTGQLFWQEQGVAPRFFRERSQIFEMQHDGKMGKYTIKFTASKSVPSIRLDPGRKPGKIVIQSIKIRGPNGKELDLLH